MLTDLLHPILNLQGTTVYLVVGALVFAEAAILLGFIFPGETAVLLGGVIASEHHVSLGWLIAVVVVAAIVGDSVGYFVGERFGPRLLALPVLRKRHRALDTAIGLLRRRGALTVFLARFTAFLRAMIPGLAGMSEMPYRTFLPANVAGGIIWGTGFTLIGFAVGGAYRRVETYSGWASDVLLGLLVVGFVFFAIRSHRKERAFEAADEVTPAAGAAEADRPGTDAPAAPTAPTDAPANRAPGERAPANGAAEDGAAGDRVSVIGETGTPVPEGGPRPTGVGEPGAPLEGSAGGAPDSVTPVGPAPTEPG